MKKRVLIAVVACLSLFLILAGTAFAATPKRVLLVSMDQMHPEYAQQFHMKNVLWLEKNGAFFPNAYVGDMASETVVSHNVMVSGLFPKNMGWSDEALRDTNDVLGGGANGIYITGSLSYDQFGKLIAARNYPKLGTYLHAAFPGTKVAFVGQKNYQVRSMTAGNGGGTDDIGVFLGSSSSANATLVGLLGGKYRAPSGINLPAYISGDTRFTVNSDSANDYGTLTESPAWIYPEDGDRMIPGIITGHQGGDNWVADAAIKIMQNENWSGLFLNFGGIDKVSHMWGGGAVDNQKNYDWDVNSIYNMVHLPYIAKNADTQLGRVIGALKALHQFDDTLIVVLADHGSTYGKHFHGVNDQAAGDYNWYYGSSITDGDYYNKPSPAIQPLVNTGNVAFSYQSTAIETWLKDTSEAKMTEAAQVMGTLPGVIATYTKSADGSSYVLFKAKSKKMTKAEYSWWKAHGQELVNTMAWSGSADVVGLLRDHTSYGAYGDHGGAQKDVQRIPMVFYNSGLAHKSFKPAARLVDVMPTIMKTMGITPTAAMDGKAYTLPAKAATK